MTSDPLFSTLSGFDTVRADTAQLFRMNPRLIYPLVLPRVRRVQGACEALLAAPQQTLLARAADVNDAVASARATLDDARRAFGLNAVAAFGEGSVVFSPVNGAQTRTRLLPLPMSALRGVRVDETYVYRENASGLLDSETVVEMFGGTPQVELRYEGVGRQALAALLTRAAYHVTVGGVRQARVDVPPDMATNARWVATRERVVVPRTYSAISGDELFDQLSDQGRVSEHVAEGDAVGAARVLRVAGQTVKLSTPLPSGEYRWRLAGYDEAVAATQPLRALVLPATLTDESERGLRDQAAVTLRVASAVTARGLWAPSAVAHMSTLRAAHFAVGADHALGLLQQGRVAEYMTISPNMAATRDMLNHVVLSTTTAGF